MVFLEFPDMSKIRVCMLSRTFPGLDQYLATHPPNPFVRMTILYDSGIVLKKTLLKWSFTEPGCIVSLIGSNFFSKPTQNYA